MENTQSMYLKAEAIYKYLTNTEEKLDNLIMCKPEDIELITTDQSIYEALGSIEDRASIDLNKLVKLMEVVHVNSFQTSMKKPRTILTHERAEEVRREKNE